MAGDPNRKFAVAIAKAPLKLASCDLKNTEGAKAILANSLDAQTQKYLGYFVLNCTDRALSQALIPQMMMQLYAQYRAGNGGNNEDHPLNYFRGDKKNDYNVYSYCGVLNRYVGQRNLVRLRELQAHKLPLHCAGRNRQLRLGSPDFSVVKASDEEKVVALIQLLRAAGVPLNDIRSPDGESILDQVIGDAPPAVIKAFLAGGIDPGYPAAVLQWVVRKHRNCEGCKGVGTSALSQEQIAHIDRTMREPSTEENNRQGTVFPAGSILFKIKDLENLPDGGAAFFRHLKSRGADVGAAAVCVRPPDIVETAEMQARLARGFLGYSNPLSPALRAELEKLTSQEIDRLAHPKVAGNNRFEEPLLMPARRMKNKALEEFLFAHQVDGCQPMESTERPAKGKK